MCSETSNEPKLLDHTTILLKSVPPLAVQLDLAECVITTDSVVATVTIRTDIAVRRVVVKWGDGIVNTLRHRPGTETAVGQPQQLPPGTYRLSHAYGASTRTPFEQYVVIRIEDHSGGVEFCIRKITLTPRYRVTNYQTTLTLASKCDSFFETESEFEITQSVDGVITHSWHWTPFEPGLSGIGTLVGDFVPFVVPGSMVSRELTVADGRIAVNLHLVEKDPAYDAKVGNIAQDLSALDVSRTVEGEKKEDATGCRVSYRYDKEVVLVVPLPSYGQSVVLVAE